MSVVTSFNDQIPLEDQVWLIAEASFTHLSLGARDDHRPYRSAAGRVRITALLRTHGLALDTIHRPRLDQPDGVEVLSQAAEVAAELGPGVVVVHASWCWSPGAHRTA